MSLMNELKQYFLTRILRWKIAVICMVLLIASQLTSWIKVPIWSMDHALHSIYVGVVVIMLIVALRIWDDLADRQYDAEHYPQRVLPRSRYLGVYIGLVLLLLWFAMYAIFIYGRTEQLRILLALITSLILVYSSVYFVKLSRTFRVRWVLLKYPLILILLSEQACSFTQLSLAIAVYGLVYADEYFSTFKLKKTESENV